MKTLVVLGHFAFGRTELNGQTIKTKIVTEELQRRLGEPRVLKIDTAGGWKTLFKAPFQALGALRRGENVLIFPAHNGVRVYVPLLSFFKRFFKGRRLHYAVVGGWLPEFVKGRRGLRRALGRFDGIYVETNVMKQALEAQGFTNVLVVPNCKRLNALTAEELVYPKEKPYRLCTFSRVMKQKGIETAARVIREVNSELGYKAYTLDVYGQVDSAEIQWFDSLKEEYSDLLEYRGRVDAQKSTEVLKDYFALLFPTHFYTEGVPGTIIDAYSAGVPVIYAKWESWADVIEDGVNGLGYDFDSSAGLADILKRVERDPSLILSMKEACLRRAEEYTPEKALDLLADRL